MKKPVLWLMAVILVGMAGHARAETLDDATIRKVYADIKAVIRDPVKSQEVLQARLDDNYVLKSDVTRQLDSQPPQKISVSRTKAQTIQDTVDNISRMKMDTYDANIASIQFSDDGKYATINDASVSTGAMTIPTDQNGTLASFKYNVRETCSHIVGLMQDQIRIMKSQCDDNVALKR